MNKQIRLSKSVIGQEEIDSVTRVLELEFLGMGNMVKIFEDDLSSFFSRKVSCVNTGTAAIQLALQAIGLKKEDEVLVQSLTYVATFQAISAIGATPIPCEIYEDTFTIDLEDAEKKITKATKAIVPMHYAGSPGNLDEIYRFAKKNNLRVIEDAAHAFGSTYNDRIIGSFGDISCFSFDGIKNITSGEGGAIVTSDLDVIQKISDARLLGVQKDTEKRFAGERSWEFDVMHQGWRYHMSNIMAAIGDAQLKKFPVFKNKRQELAKQYYKLLASSGKIKLLKHNYSQVVPHIFIIRVAPNLRDEIKNYLESQNIQTGLHYKPNHMLSYYKYLKTYKLPVTEKIYDEIITLPLHPDLDTEDITLICEKLLRKLEG